MESSIAEKLKAIVKNGFLNSRYKDFYDIFVLSEKYPFNYEKLNNAVTETFTNRNTPITMDTPAFSNEFLSDSIHQTRWNSFLKKKRALIPVSLLLYFYWLGVYYTDRNSYYFVPLESQYSQRSLEVFFFYKNVICVIC